MNGIQVFLAAYAQPLIWLAVALVMLIIEAATVQMVSIWFCLGAVAAAIAARVFSIEFPTAPIASSAPSGRW